MSQSGECKAVVERVEDLATLSAHHAQLEEPHLVVCSDCRDQVARTRDVLAGLDALPVQAPKADVSDRVMMRIQSAPAPAWAAKRAAAPVRAKVEPKSEPVRRPVAEPQPGFLEWLASVLTPRNLAVPAMGLAVVLFALVAIKPVGQQVARTTAPASPIVEEPELIEAGAPGITVASLTGEVSAFVQGEWKKVAAGGTVAAGQRLQIGRGSKASLTLPDGSKIDVGAETELVAFSERVRVHHGHARFDVMHRPERIFRVLVPDGEIRVLGTLFDVDAAAAGSRVHLLHGRIEVQCAAQVERLEDGDSATIGAGKLTKLAAADHAAGAGPLPSTGTPVASEASPDSVGADPRPAIQATAASGPAPAGLK